MAERLSCAFEQPSLARFAAHADQSSVKVWDAHSGKLKVQTAEGTTERSVGLGWAGGFLWNANRSGRLVLWSLARNTVAAALTLPTPAPFTAAVATDTDVYTATEGQGVVRWSLSTKQFAQQVCQTKEAVECLAVSRSGKLMLLARTSIRLYSLGPEAEEPGKKKRKTADSELPVKAVAQHKYKGHTATVRSLIFSHDETLFASAAASDRFVHVWRTDSSTAHATLSAESPVHSIDISSHHQSNSFHLLGVTDSGVICIWQVPTARAASSKPVAARTIVRLATGPELILAATFSSPTDLLVVRGTPVRPAFERMAYLTNGEPIAEVELAVRSAAGPQAASKTGGPIETLWVAEANKPAAVTDGTAAAKRGKKNKSAEKEADTRPLTEKLEAAGIRINEGGDLQGKDGKAPRADSVLHLLTQALHTKDSALLEVCLAQSDPAMVSATVSRLSTPHVLPLLAALVQRLQGRPTRAAQLVTWLRALLVAHTAYLLSVPELARSLSPLFQALDARLSVFRKLLALSGRLDLLLSLKSTAKLASVSAPAVFDEREGGGFSSNDEDEEEEGDEEGEGEEEEGDEEGEEGSEEESGSIAGPEEADGEAEEGGDEEMGEKEEPVEEEAPQDKKSKRRGSMKQ